MWRTWMFGFFERNEYEVVVSSNRSMLHLGTSELKVISMIYAPPYLMRRRNRRCSRSQARNVSEGNRGSTQEENTGNTIDEHASITMKQSRERNNKKATQDNETRSHLSSR